MESLHLKHYVSRPAYKGHRPEEGAWDGTELTKMEVHPAELSDEGKAVLDAYLASCKADSIDVVLVNSPMYVGVIDKIIGLDEADLYFEKIARKYGYHYLNYVNECPISQDTNNFCVSVHMNSEAIKVFTTLLCDTLQRLSVFN